MPAVKDLTDEALVALVRTEDQELYAEVVQRYQDKLLRYANYIIGDEQMAADVVQQSFIKAFINLNGFDIKRKFSSWIYRIVHNEAVNFIKKNKSVVSFEDNQWLEEKLSSQEDIEEKLSLKETKEMLYQALEKLPLKYRSPLVLFYLQDKSYEEISDVLRLPIGTVGTRINRGKKLMLNIFSKINGEEYGKKS